ncbi:4'-phosphopantetheinyl transferase superfamily protein [Anaerocolumna jejuensis]|uniref:4'-phosphopantetheinyl transferase superfamily protein n=1 Tax=Anaerocolumna jejuensis TaxID=259063 RepID=UPI0038BB38E5
MQLFYDFWTLKESYVKAVGKGLSIPIRCILGIKFIQGVIHFTPFNGIIKTIQC